MKLTNRPINRVITIFDEETVRLDDRTSELLDIIDSYGGTNPYPRFAIDADGYMHYSCTTKIPTENIIEFDKEINTWRSKQ